MKKISQRCVGNNQVFQLDFMAHAQENKKLLDECKKWCRKCQQIMSLLAFSHKID
nr:hypothetical protein [Campylobacter hyointestinalis]